jgi:predicted ATPase/DNA-binding SARP family transcriptional activator
LPGQLATPLEYRVLGPLEVGEASGPLTISAPRVRRLLLSLLLDANEVVSVDRLADRVWGGRPPASAGKLIQHYVSQLRRTLGGEAIETHSAGYVLRVAPEASDIARFELLAGEGAAARAAGNHELASALCRRALSLWRGAAFAEIADEEFARARVDGLEERRLVCLETAVAAELEVGRHDDLLPQLAAACVEYPLRERLRAQLMTCLYRAGRQADALAVYRDARQALRDGLGLEPGEELRRIERRVLNQDPALDAPPASAPGRLQLPAPSTPLVGRERDLKRLARILERPENRLLTLAGAAGSGKTRLALELARRCADTFANGVQFVELAEVSRPEFVLSAIAQRLDVSERRSEPLLATLVEALGGLELLLVLDNLEHLVPVAADLARLAAQCPRLAVVVTSRRVLHVTGEHVYPVEPLTDEDALALFVSRADAASPSFRLTPGLEPVLLEICRRLDSLPLAIELAAARARMLQPHQLLERLGNRLALLTTGPRDLPARQQTLRATIEWSVELLTGDERRLLGRLGVFAGGFTLEAVEAVCGEGDGRALDRLAALLDLNLLQQDPADRRRFRLFETVREYALEVGETADLDVRRRAHARHHLELAERLAEEVERGGSAALLALLDGDLENLRAALGTLRDAGDADALRLAAALWRYWWLRGLVREGRRVLEEVLERHDAPTAMRARAERGAAILALREQDIDAARDHAVASARIARELDDPTALARALMSLGNVAVTVDDYDSAHRHYDESAELFRRAAAPERDRAVLLLNMGDLALYRADFVGAEALAGRSLDHFRAIGDDAGIAASLSNMAFAILEQGRHDRARDLLEESVRRAEALGFDEWLSSALLGLAVCAAHAADPERAAKLLGTAQRVREDAGATLPPFEERLRLRTEARLRAALGDDGYATRHEAGAHASRGSAPLR